MTIRKKTKGVIACGHQNTLDAGKFMFEEGGNAFDALVACLFTSFISEPIMSSAGGGGFMNAILPNKKNYLLDFFCQTPLVKKKPSDLDFYPIRVDYGTSSEEFYLGLGSVATPGMLKGIFHMYEKFCSLPMKVLSQPAIELAKNGVKINKFAVMNFKLLGNMLKISPDLKRIFFPNNIAYKEGEIQKMENLADFLEHITYEGIDNFYRGDIAQKVNEVSSENGGSLSFDDLKNYEIKERNGLIFSYRNKQIATNPFPSIGGEMLKLALEYLEKKEIHDPKSNKYTQTIYSALSQMMKQKESLLKKFNSTKRGSTTQMSIVDDKGNALSTTVSIGEGCGYTIAGTGVLMNNMLGESALLPNGFHSWNENERLSSMMSPTLVLNEKEEVEIITGTGGASRIPSAITQILAYIIDHKMDVETAVMAPRLHPEHNILNTEPLMAEPLELLDGDEYLPWNEQGMMFGGVHTIVRKGNEYFGAADLRRAGVVERI